MARASRDAAGHVGVEQEVLARIRTRLLADAGALHPQGLVGVGKESGDELGRLAPVELHPADPGRLERLADLVLRRIDEERDELGAVADRLDDLARRPHVASTFRS